MKRLLKLLVVVIATTGVSFATNVGEPMDCSDLVFIDPEYSCDVIAPANCREVGPDFNPFCGTTSSTGILVDNENQRFKFGTTTEVVGTCGTGSKEIPLHRAYLTIITPTNATPIAYIDQRCAVPGANGVGPSLIEFVGMNTSFEPKTGRWILEWRAYTESDNYTDTHSVIAIDGFASQFDVQQSYDPLSNQISFRVPTEPNGFPGADWFNVYHGDLQTVGDWSQAQPLRCGFPTSIPNAGDSITMVDTLPDPAPGMGRYYITTVNYQGQIRYGRSNEFGTLIARDPSVLPACDL